MPQSTLTYISVFPPFTNNTPEISSETFRQGSWIFQKVAEKNEKLEGSLQGSACRYFSFMKRGPPPQHFGSAKSCCTVA